MRQTRVKVPSVEDGAMYHCVSRVVDRRFIFDKDKKVMFVQFMREYEQFCGVQVLTYCLMSNHFHILLEVPKKPETMPDGEEVVRRLRENRKGTFKLLKSLLMDRSLGSQFQGQLYPQLHENMKIDNSSLDVKYDRIREVLESHSSVESFRALRCPRCNGEIQLRVNHDGKRYFVRCISDSTHLAITGKNENPPEWFSELPRIGFYES